MMVATKRRTKRTMPWLGPPTAVKQQGHSVAETQTLPASCCNEKYAYVQKQGSRIVALQRSDGKEVWQWKQPSNFLQNGAVAVHNKRLFGSTVRGVTAIPYAAEIVAFEEVDHGGCKPWSYDRAGGDGGLTAPVVTDSKLIFGSSA